MWKINLLLMVMYYFKFFFFIFFVVLVSCGGQKSERKIDHDKVTIEVEEILFPSQNVLQLKSYYLSSPIHTDSEDVLVGYNYRLHSLDYMNLNSKLVTQAMLSNDGPNAITRISGIYAHTLDSVWVFDESERVFLIDSMGDVKKTLNLRKYLEDDEQLLIITNHAMFTSHLHYNEARRSLMFLVKNLSSKTFKVKEVFVDKGNEGSAYKLSPSKIIPDLSEGYTYMDAPNVNFVGENIIYNYPAESSIYTLNINTNERKVIEADSRYTSNIVEKCTTGKDYSVLEKHRIENPHFYDVMYLSKFNIYARLHLDKVKFDAKKGMEKLMNERDLYLMLFDEKLDIICEIKLLKYRYNYFTGWNVSSAGITLFVDNILDEKNVTDDLIIDLISPKSLNLGI